MMLPMLSIPHNPYIFTFFLILPCLTTEEIVGVRRMQRRHEREISDHAIIHYNITTWLHTLQRYMGWWKKKLLKISTAVHASTMQWENQFWKLLNPFMHYKGLDQFKMMKCSSSEYQWHKNDLSQPMRSHHVCSLTNQRTRIYERNWCCSWPPAASPPWH